MSFFYDLNKKLDSIRATPEVTHQQLNERDMSRAAKGIMKYGKDGMQALRDAEAEGKALDPIRKKYDKYDNKEVDEGVMDTVKSVGKKVASGINKLVGHGSDEDMRRDLQRKSGAPVTGKKPEQKTTEAAKYRDPKYKDKLYTQEPPDYTYGPDMDDAYYNPKPDDYAGRKRKIGGGEFDHNDPLKRGQGIGRSGIKNNILDRGPRKGMPSRDQITSLKGSIKSARGTHAEPNLPEAAGSIDYEKVLEAIAALYGDDMWDNDAMGDLAQDLEQAGPTDRELDFIIAKGKLPTRLKGIRFTNTDDVQFGHLDEKSGDQMTATGKKLNFADKIASAKKEVDEMLGDVAAEAMRSALSPKQKKIDMNKNGKLDANDFAMLRKGAKSGGKDEMDEENAFTAHKRPAVTTPKVGSVERGHKHDIKHTATGRMVTRRVDDQGNSVGSETDDEGNKKEKRTKAGRPDGTGKKIGAKGPSGRSKLMTKEGEVDVTDQGEYDQEGDMAKDDIKTIVRHAQALSKVLGDDDNLPEWVQSKLAKIEGMMISIDEYMQNQAGDDDSEEPIAEEPRSKNQAVAARIARGVQKGTAKAKPGSASAEMAKMQPKELNKFAKGSTKGLPDKVKSKKKEKEVDESTTSGSVATSTATTGSKGGVFGKGIYDSMNRELENMIAESMSINMSDSTEGGKSLTVTATDEDAMKLAMMLKSAGVGGHDHDMHSGMAEAVDENSPDYPTNTQQAENNFGYPGGLNKPKTDVAGDGQTTIPNTAVHTQDEDALRRMMEMAGLAQANLTPGKHTMQAMGPEMSYSDSDPEKIKYDNWLRKASDKDLWDEASKYESVPDYIGREFEKLVAQQKELLGPAAYREKGINDRLKSKLKKYPNMSAPMKEEEEVEEDFLESIQRMREIAGIKEAKKDLADKDYDGDGKLETGAEEHAGSVDKAIKKSQEEKKVDESIFALTNQWRAYKG